MHCLNTRYGLYYNKKYKRIGYVFRDRYKAEGIYSEEQLHNCIKYIYDNPVKAGVCNKAEEYEFSNYKKINFTNTREYSFIDIEEDKRVVCNKLVKEFLKIKELKLKDTIKQENVYELTADNYTNVLQAVCRAHGENRPQYCPRDRGTA